MDAQTLHHRPSKSKARSHIEYGALHHGQQRRFYKPLMHHTLALCVLLFTALSLIAVVEYSIYILPHHQLSPGKTYGQARKRDLLVTSSDPHKQAPLAGIDLPVANAAFTTSRENTTTATTTRTPDFAASSSPTPVQTLQRRSGEFCSPILVQPVVEEVKIYAKPKSDSLKTSKALSIVTVLTKQYFVTSLPFSSSTGYNTPIRPTLAPMVTKLHFPLLAPSPLIHKRQVNTCLNSTVTPPPITQSSSAYVDPAVKTDVPITLLMGADGRRGSAGAKGGDIPSQDGDKVGSSNAGAEKDGAKAGNTPSKDESARGGSNAGGSGALQGNDQSQNDPAGGKALGVGDGNEHNVLDGSTSNAGGRDGDHDLDMGQKLGTPYTTRVNGQQMVVTPILSQSPSPNAAYTTNVNGIEVLVTPKAIPYTTLINGLEVLVAPTPTQDSSLKPYTTMLDGTAIVVTPRATPYTTTVGGKEIVITPTMASGDDIPYTTVVNGKKVVVTPKASAYTTTIDGVEIVVTPRPGAARKTVVASVSGQSKKTTMTLSLDAARASRIAEDDLRGHDQDDVPSSWKGLTFTESDKNLTFIKSPTNYFAGVYLPVLLAVVFQMMVFYLYTTTKMMEPFAMLSTRSDGISAKDFLWINYLSANDSLEPFTAMASGHWLMLWMSILYTAAQVISPLSSEMLGIYPGYKKTSTERVMAGASLWVHPQVARLTQGILLLVSVLIVATWFLLRKYQPRVYDDPSSIAGVATLTDHPSTSRLLSSIDLATPKEEILEILAGTRYRLGWYTIADTERYGIIVTSLHHESKSPHTFHSPDITLTPSSPPDSRPLTPTPGLHATLEAESTNLLSTSPYRSKLRMQLFLNIFFFSLLATLLALIVAYTYSLAHSPDIEDTSYRRFMSAGTFGPRFLLTSAGMLIRGQWSRLERRAVVRAPFERAAAGADHDNDINTHNKAVLEGRTLIPLTTLLKFLSRPRRDGLSTALLAFAALMAESLVIILPGVPFDSGQLYVAAVVSRYASLALLGTMLLALVGYWLWRLSSWKKGVKLARTPNTVGTMLAMTAGTGLASALARKGERELSYANGNKFDGFQEPGEKATGWIKDRQIRILRRRVHGKEEGERLVVDFD